jgi:2'-5' RNA ligase
MRRLFIAINLPDGIKNTIEKFVSNFKISVNQRSHQRESAAEMRFLPKENWHLTLVFLGYQPDEAISPILESIKETAKNFPSPAIEFEKIIWAPPGKTPRMIWLCGTKETSKALGEIKKYLDDSLIKNGVGFQKENRLFNTHLTLARFHQTRINADSYADKRGCISARLPAPERSDGGQVNQHINQRQSALAFYANSIDLMESHLKRTGAEYEILSKMDFIK